MTFEDLVAFRAGVAGERSVRILRIRRVRRADMTRAYLVELEEDDAQGIDPLILLSPDELKREGLGEKDMAPYLVDTIG